MATSKLFVPEIVDDKDIIFIQTLNKEKDHETSRTSLD